MSDFWAAQPLFLVPDPRDLTDEQVEVLHDVKRAMGRSIDLAGPDWPLDPRRPAIGLFGVEGPWTAPADGGFDEIWPLVLQGRWTVTASEKGGAPWRMHGEGFDLLWIDIETYSPVDLAKAGVYKYTEHPDWRILMCSWALNDGEVQRAEGHEAILAIPGLFDKKVLKVAHNASFERINLSRLKSRKKFLPPEQFFDTAALARAWGLPASLKDFALALGAEEKDEAGTRLINLFSKPSRKGERVTKEEKPEDWAAFGAYCDQDVETMRQAAKRLDCGFPRMEDFVYDEDQRINDRGVRVDVELARAAERCFKDNRAEALKEIEKIAGVDNGNSVAQLRAWLRSRGVDTEDLRKDTVKELLEGDLPDDVRRVLVLRQECAVSAAAKFTAAIRATNDDGRLRGTMQYFGASTGRFAGRLIQFQNLARDGFKKPGPDGGYDTQAEEAAVGRLLEGGSVPSPELKKLIRPLLMGPFVVCDYSSIEPRVLAWLSGEQWMIDAFNNNEDIYVATAAKLGGPERGFDRQHGKTCTLSCGYAGGVGAMLKMGGRNIMPKGTPEDILRKELRKIVTNWRDKSPAVRRFWSQLERIINTGGGVDTGLVSIEVKGQDRYVWLPSKRPIVYRGLTRRWRQPLDVDGTPLGPARLVPHVLNTGGDRARVPYKPLHGGIITENIVQAVARDILVQALRNLEEAGWPVVTHIHDEVVCEIPEDKRDLSEDALITEVSEIMCRPPYWADDDLVIKAAGYTCQRYHKE